MTSHVLVQTGGTSYSPAMTHAQNPLFGPNRFKLGIFSANCDGGLTMSLAPERWKANWDDIVAMTQGIIPLLEFGWAALRK